MRVLRQLPVAQEQGEYGRLIPSAPRNRFALYAAPSPDATGRGGGSEGGPDGAASLKGGRTRSRGESELVEIRKIHCATAWGISEKKELKTKALLILFPSSFANKAPPIRYVSTHGYRIMDFLVLLITVIGRTGLKQRNIQTFNFLKFPAGNALQIPIHASR